MQAEQKMYPVEGEKDAGVNEFIENSSTRGKPDRTDSSDAASDEDIELDGINEKALIRKIDYRLVPWLSLLYLLSFLDRTNIGNAALFGLRTNIGIDVTQYNTCLAIFFAFYVLFEVPSNLVMKAWRPSMWLPIIMIAWGAVMIGMGFIQNFRDLFITRIFLGITEAGLFPGVSFFLTQWYRRYEINFRIALFFSAATAAGAFGGLLARLINEMDGAAGYEGWRWIFILEGIATVVIAVASVWMLYDYPDTAKFLTPTEKAFVVRRLKRDNDGCSQRYDLKFMKDAFLDWKVWVFSLMFHFCLTPVYSFSLFSPTLTANLGYAAARAQLMSVPPYVLAAITTVLAGYFSDKMQIRAPIIMISSATGALGFIMLRATGNVGVQYTGLFLAAAGGYPLIPLVVSWGSNNVGGSLKKGVATAIIVSVGNAGGCISSFVYPLKDRPRYAMGHTILLVYDLMVFVLAAFMWWYLNNENKKKDAINAAHGPWTAEEKLAREDDGERVEWFRYAV